VGNENQTDTLFYSNDTFILYMTAHFFKIVEGRYVDGRVSGEEAIGAQSESTGFDRHDRATKTQQSEYKDRRREEEGVQLTNPPHGQYGLDQK
jgi:hypothetical protein